jgi:hypothetical protein
MTDKANILKAIRKLEAETAVARNAFEAVAAKWDKDQSSETLDAECRVLYGAWLKVHNALQNARDQRVKMKRLEKMS